MIIAWKFLFIIFLLLMRNSRGYKFKDGREMDRSADNTGQGLIRIRMGNRKSKPTA
jgi:hypothetical protein